MKTILALLVTLASALQHVEQINQPAALVRTTLDLPFSASGRDIVSSNGTIVTYLGTNWPGHLDAMIPEGLQYSSIKGIVDKIKGFGLNAVRLTYATQMVDEIYDKGQDTTLIDTLTTALGSEDASLALSRILRNNPALSEDATRLQVYDAVAEELARQGIIVHLDNHVSKAGWCCLPGDGNGWFSEKYFDVDNWIRGWEYMAHHASTKWPTLASFGLRNELRGAFFNYAEPYDWYTWNAHMTDAAAAIHAAAPNALIFFGSLQSDHDISPIPLGKPLYGTPFTRTGGKVAYFDPELLAYRDKIVLELHKYDGFVIPFRGPCSIFETDLYGRGFQALDPGVKYSFPVVITEWGFQQDNTTWRDPYNQCLIGFTRKHKVGFTHWVLAGSYYIRQGTIDGDESWGLLNHGWNDTRSLSAVKNSLQEMIAASQQSGIATPNAL